MMNSDGTLRERISITLLGISVTAIVAECSYFLLDTIGKWLSEDEMLMFALIFSISWGTLLIFWAERTSNFLLRKHLKKRQ